MRERQLVAVDRDHVRRSRRGEHVGRSHELERRTAERGCRGQRLARLRRELGDSLADEGLERRRKGLASLEQDRASLEGSAELEGIERVPAGQPVQAAERRQREDQPEPVAHQAVQRTGAEPGDRHSLHVLEARNDVVEVSLATRKQEHNRIRPESPRCKADHRCRRRIEPLDVVDDDEQRAARRDEPQDAVRRDTERASIRRGRAILEEKGDAKSACLRLGKLRQRVLQQRLEEVPDRGKRELGLRLDRTRCERLEPALASEFGRDRTQRGLPDTGRALQQECRAAAGVGPLEERVDRRELAVAAHDLEGARLHPRRMMLRRVRRA